MESNIVYLPRPHDARLIPRPLALFVRVGHNDHREMLDLIATGERGASGFVIDAQNVKRHRELITEAQRRGFDLILDPKTQQMGFEGGHTASLAAFPWGAERHHSVSDFEGIEGRSRADQIVEMAAHSGFTQILGPTHLLSGPNDPWLRRDIAMMEWTYESIIASGAELGLIYSLAVPMAEFRKREIRQALIAAIADAPCDAIWLKVENYGDDATGEKTVAYIEACRDFHERGIPLVGDHVGGLPGLGALAFGAVGGIAHGVTMNQAFRAARWRRPRRPSNGGPTWRVYLPQIDMLVKPDVAKSLLATSRRIRGSFGCTNSQCGPHGVRDMISRPARHALYQRTREIEMLSETPTTIRADRYMDRNVRPVSDNVALLAGDVRLDSMLRNRLVRKQGDLSRFRQSMAHLAEAAPLGSIAISPSRRGALEVRVKGKRAQLKERKR